MVAGVISKSIIESLYEVINLLLLQSETWNLKTLYPQFYKQGKELTFQLKNHLTFNKRVFEEVNDWIGAYCNAFNEFDLAKEDLDLYKLLMNFTTSIPWMLAYDNDDIDTYVIGKE